MEYDSAIQFREAFSSESDRIERKARINKNTLVMHLRNGQLCEDFVRNAVGLTQARKMHDSSAAQHFARMLSSSVATQLSSSLA
jgi:hypothetical protein